MKARDRSDGSNISANRPFKNVLLFHPNPQSNNNGFYSRASFIDELPYLLSPAPHSYAQIYSRVLPYQRSLVNKSCRLCPSKYMLILLGSTITMGPGGFTGLHNQI